jgi:hypothetical protein
MARLGLKGANKDTEQGNLYFGQKDIDFLKKNSREAVEIHHNNPIIYLETDWDNSMKNIYGEITLKKFKVATGVQIIGSLQLTQGNQSKENGIITNKMHLILSIYTEQLSELNINPKRGDYFYVGKRYYYIYKKSIDDAGIGEIMINRERLRCDYFAYEEDNELIQKNLQINNGDEFDQLKQTGTIL